MIGSFASFVAFTVACVSAAGTVTDSASLPDPTLHFGFRWIRDLITDTYLQGNPPLSESQAILGSSDTAGQFNIVSETLIQLTSVSPSYTYTTVDTSTGALMFVNGDVAPSSAGKFSWTSLDKELNWTAPDGTLYTEFLVCDSKLYVPLNGLAFSDDCTSTIITALKTVNTE